MHWLSIRERTTHPGAPGDGEQRRAGCPQVWGGAPYKTALNGQSAQPRSTPPKIPLVDKQHNPFCVDKKSDVRRSSVTAQSHKVNATTSLDSPPSMTSSSPRSPLQRSCNHWSLTAARKANSPGRENHTHSVTDSHVVPSGVHSAVGKGF